MDAVEQERTRDRLRQPNIEQLCPECGAIMTKADGLVEGRAMFIWYACSRVGCDGQWLRKFSKDTQNV
jgi:hypothetical protein